MELNVQAEMNILESMTTGQLRERYVRLFGEETRSRHRRHLIRRIIWRIQAEEYGGLSERARQRAREIANICDVRTTAPRESIAPPPVAARSSDPRLPAPGHWIVRDYKRQQIRVLVLEDGFEFDGRRYASLSAVAKDITGTHVNGFRFFKLGGQAK